MRRGDSSTSVIIFLTVLMASLLLTTWYIQAVRPTRQAIGTVMEDMEELRQHFANACGATRYNATYLFATTSGFYTGNETHFCIHTEVFGNCKNYPCEVTPQRIALSEGTVVRVERDAGPVWLSTA